MGQDEVVALGRMLGDATQVALLDALFDGRAYTVTELRRHVGVAASTTSEHLRRLLDANLVTTEPQGRHRYYRLANADVADMLERVFEVGNGLPVTRSSKVPAAMAYARSCYDHLAGTVAVGLTDHLADRGIIGCIEAAPMITPAGRELFASMELPDRSPSSRRPTVRRCLDWSERRAHLAGVLPAGLFTFMVDERWFIKKPSSRALELTAKGRDGLASTFGYVAP